jgi:hypothetical protein
MLCSQTNVGTRQDLPGSCPATIAGLVGRMPGGQLARHPEAAPPVDCRRVTRGADELCRYGRLLALHIRVNIAVHLVEPTGDAANIGSLHIPANAGSSAGAANFQQTLAVRSQAADLEASGGDKGAAAKQGKAAPEQGNARSEKKPASVSGSSEPTQSAGAENAGPVSTAQVGSSELPPILVPMALPLATTGGPLPAPQIVAVGDHATSGDDSAVAAITMQQGSERSLPLTGGAADPVLSAPPSTQAIRQGQDRDASGAMNSKGAGHDSAPVSAHGSAGKVATPAALTASALGMTNPGVAAGSAGTSSEATDVEQRNGSPLTPISAHGSMGSSTKADTVVTPAATPVVTDASGAGSVADAGTVVGSAGAAQNPTAGSDAQSQSGNGGAKQASSDGQVSSTSSAPGAGSFAAAAITQAVTEAGSAPAGGIGGVSELVAPAAAKQATDAQAAASGAPTELPATQVAQGGAINAARVLETMNGTEMRVGIHSADFGSVSIAATMSPSGVAAQIALEHGALGQALSTHFAAIEEKLGATLGVHARVEMQDTGSTAIGGNGERPPGGNSGAAGSNASSGGSTGGGRSRGQPSGDQSYTAALEPLVGRSAVTAGRLSVQA